jgi:hypothetical protein|tara:strand:- start:1502 stop:3331 length:1830 start_codon:yes stop_codon:yes gene_type:complete
MAYQINKTDGTIVATVADGQVDNLSTDLTLIGKNYSGFGEAFNENLIKLLENFSSTSAPTHPIKGQIWYDTSELKLKVYNGSSFIPVSSATISNTQPSTLAIGDLWWDDVGGQLYFFDGTTPILIGPAYSNTQGLSGLKVDSILDTLNQTRVVTYLYNNGILLGIFAKDSFTPKNDIIGYSGSIGPGFNAGTLAGIKFDVTCTNAEQLGGAAATIYIRRDTSNALEGQLRITTDLGLVVGSAGQLNLYVTAGDVYMSNASTDKKLVLNVRKGIDQEDAISISAVNRTVDIYEGFTDSVTTIGGDLTVIGNLTVEGTQTVLNTETLTVEDTNIIIANVASPTDDTANGAGLTIKGATDKTIAYSTSDNWLDISETINLASGKALYIGDTLVINGNSLGSAITSIPGVTSFGKQTVVNVGPGGALDPAYLRLADNRISTLSSDLDIELAPDGAGNVALIGSPKITGLADPAAEQDAATKEYTDNRIESRPLVFSIDLSDGKPNTYIIANILNNLAPPTEFRTGTVARVLCNLISNSSVNLAINSLPPSQSTAQFLTNLGGATAPAVTNISFPTATIPGQSVSTTRIVKQFSIAGLAGSRYWQHDSDIILPA